MEVNNKIANLIQNMPKVVLHLHLDGSLRPERVLERIREGHLNKEKIEKWYNKGEISEDEKLFLLEVAEKSEAITIEDVKNYLSVDKNCTNLNQYLEKFILPCALLQTEKDIEESTYDLFEDLAKQNVKYAEVRFAPSKHCMQDCSQEKIVLAAIRGMNRAKGDFDIDGNLILCSMRGKGEENTKANLETLELTHKYLNNGVCAMDLAGAEALFKTQDFEDYLFKKAVDYKVPLTIHAGEADGPESIKCAIKYAKRIGHGVRCIEDKGLMEYIRNNNIVLEVCPTSNMQTQAVSGKHPLEELYKAGLGVTISTDNDTVSNISINEELENILKTTNLTIIDLLNMQENAARGAFIPLPERAKLIAVLKNFDKEKEFIK